MTARTESPVRRAFFAAMTTGAIADAVRGVRTVWAAYSGGADSTALLALLQEYCAGRALSLAALHVHHGIRGAEADRDEAACRDFCAARGIPLTVRRVDAPAFAAAGRMGLEEAARRLRLEIFDELCTEDAVVATAHSADDNLETVLQRLARGAALRGLCGIAPVSGRRIRPLLGVSAAAIRDFCRAEGLPFVVDSTNGDLAYTRNYLRAEVIPALRRVNPSPETAAARMCAALRADEEYLEAAAAGALGEWAGGTSAPAALVAALPDALCLRALARLYANARRSVRDLSAVHLWDAARLVRRGGAGALDLPGGICARLAGGVIAFAPAAPSPPPPDADFRFEMTQGTFSFPEYGFCVTMEPESAQKREQEKNIYKLSTCMSLSFATIQGSFFLRFRRAGDTVRFGGMTRDVRKLLAAAGYAAGRRPLVPLFCDEAGVVWVPGYPARDGARGAAPDVRLTVAFRGDFFINLQNTSEEPT